MKKHFSLALLALFTAASAFAQDATSARVSNAGAADSARYGNEEEKTSLDLFSADGSYVFESEIKDGRAFGEQDAIDTAVGYSHRFLINGHIYFRAGVDYARFDFGQTTAPLPDHLQSISARLALEYMVGDDVGAFLQFNPGFYTETHFGISSFDVPITGGRVFILQKDRLYLFLGANVAFLRGQYPVLPLVGLVWRPNQQWTVNAVLPNPRIIYAPNKMWDFYLGGELNGGSFRTDRDNTILPRRLSNAQVDYSEYRAGLGVSYNPCEAVSIDLAGGYVFQRRFNFERADKEYKADGAPYIRVSLNASF